MSASHAIGYPAQLDRADPRAVHSDDRPEVERNVRLAEEYAHALEATMETAEFAGDDAAYDRAADSFDEAYSLLLRLEAHLLDLEDRDGRAEERGLRTWFRWASL